MTALEIRDLLKVKKNAAEVAKRKNWKVPKIQSTSLKINSKNFPEFGGK